MLPQAIALGLIAVGALALVAGLVRGLAHWRSARLPRSAAVLFYGGTVCMLVGLQPIRPFRLECAEPYLVPAKSEATATLFAHLLEEGWVIGVARPASLANEGHPLQPEIADRFAGVLRRQPMLGGDDGPSFVFVGRAGPGWSRNPRTAVVAFALLAGVMLISSARRMLRAGRRP